MSSESTADQLLVYPRVCPVCGISSSYVYAIDESHSGDRASWYRCQCGVVFQENYPKADCYDEKYAANYMEQKEGETRQVHAARIYAPLIEELTYGRKLLDVGYATPRVMNYFEDRGWITWGIDTGESYESKGHLYKGDFETADFSIKVTNKDLEALADGESKIERTFDLIWMSHVIEHFRDPIGVLRKCFNLLSETGVLYIAVPDIEFINKTGVPGWPHWKAREHYVMWSESALKREAERVGFKTIMSRRNFSSRFNSWYDIQAIFQKNYF